jgi:hypothetical protein
VLSSRRHKGRSSVSRQAMVNFQDFGFQDLGFQDLGFQDLGFQDLGFQDLGRECAFVVERAAVAGTRSISQTPVACNWLKRSRAAFSAS